MSRALLLAAPLGFLLLLSCQKYAPREVPQSVVADARSAFSVVADLPLWSLAQGLLTPKENIPIGEKLTVLGQSTKIVQSGREREFVQVRRMSASEGWVRADYVVSRSILAVVTTDDAVIYTVPHNTAATTASIPRLTILAIHAETGGMTFLRVTAFDPAAKLLLKGVYLRNEGVSSKPGDVQAAILLQLAAASKSPKQQQAFLKTAIKDYPDSIFMPELTAALAGPAAAQAPQPPKGSPTATSTGTMLTAVDGAKVYDTPNETGKVLATLARDQKVVVVERTPNGPASTDDAGSSWYRIRDPSGWVNGASLAPVN